MRLLATAFYFCLLVPLRWFARRRGLDPLMLEKSDRESYWIARPQSDDPLAYFDDTRLDQAHESNATVAAPVARGLHRLLRRRAQANARGGKSELDRDGTISDENYTLW